MKRPHFTVLIGIALMVFAGLTRWQNLTEEPNIITDGHGYHAYLPAVFIYQDLQFSFADSASAPYYPAEKRAGFIVRSESGNVNKYFVGTAVLQAPFFVIACTISWLMGIPVDGYSLPFQLMVGVAALFYLVFGMWFLSRALLNMGFRQTPAMAAVVVMLFGTNLLYYTLYEPSMSHVYSFFTVSAFIYYVHAAVVSQRITAWIGVAFTLGLTVLIRPTNGLIVLGIPAIAGGLNTLTAIESLFKHKRILFLSLLVVMGVVAVQPIIYLIQTGSAFVWSYKSEGFNFASPEIFNVLFSYRKGLFVYSPVLLLAVVGMLSAIEARRSRYIWLVLFLSIVTWVISSWWMWFYGGCYGQRSFIEYLPFFAIGLAFTFRSGWGVLKPWFFYSIAILLLVLSLVQTYQYVQKIIPFDNMNKEKYWNLFLHTGDDLAWYYAGYAGQNSYKGIDSLLITYDMEDSRNWNNEKLTNEASFRGKSASKMSATDHYGITLQKPVSELPLQPNLVRVSGWVRSNSWTTGLAFVCSIEDSTGAGYYWHKYPLRPQFEGINEWSYVSALFKCGFPRSASDRFIIYPLKSDGSTIYFDDMEISFIYAR
ncbi:MAG: hypothetical protein JKX84_04055 [Flavobacteriales bacterium]|nr:hypothetical protein [Flavobacteriales bacterium]